MKIIVDPENRFSTARLCDLIADVIDSEVDIIRAIGKRLRDFPDDDWERAGHVDLNFYREEDGGKRSRRRVTAYYIAEGGITDTDTFVEIKI